jgi:L-ascorbate metabolism protein UlaG (beta-lactamase superfamily)
MNSTPSTWTARPGRHAGPPSGPRNLKSTLRLTWDFLFNKPRDTRPAAPIPVAPLTRADLDAAPDDSLWRLGHSTVLLKLEGRFWLTDPVFGERASPFRHLGPRRFHAPPITPQELPPLEAVILSHDHYDHLDKATIQLLATRARHFVAPSGVGDLLADWGVARERIRQLGWWESTNIAGLTLVATPAQHFSGRGLGDANRRLWCSWVIQSPRHRIFFSGDTGYFEGFRAIGERYGPFDLTLMEAGAYDERWAAVHMLPAQSLQAHLDLQGRWMLPIHNSTFDLAFHRWSDPLESLSQLAAARDVALLTPIIGTRLDLHAPQATPAWWRQPAAKQAQARTPACGLGRWCNAPEAR